MVVIVDGDHQPGDWAGDADVQQDAPVLGRLFELDEGPHGAERADRQRDEVGQRDVGVMQAPGDVMAELMGQQDRQQADREGDPAGEVAQDRHHQVA